ncbi:restriction endonuclease subunit S [Moritella viscosa]|uniref:restriction endonuclease subunit S n=1 Tax=Moritella viscosa TaxID=80854 RepID=UPI0009155986|nr:restriction endonuclease subunit S [Moritella viscosa]SGZ02068.1 Type I restriction modification DNA specificity domain protein [Moritella viscosa]
MGNNWKTTTLGEIALGKDGAVDGPFGSNLPASCYVDIGTPVIRGSNLSKGLDEFKDEGFVFVPDDILKKLSRSECVADDIIFTKKGTLGQTGLIKSHYNYTRYLLSSNQMRLRVDTAVALPEYVYYWVSSQKAIHKLIKDSECTGVPKINLAYLKSFPIDLPSIEVQQNIIDVLKSLNSKIELNRQTNQTLEKMAQTLFKNWFVDFDPVLNNLLTKVDFKLENLASDFPVELLEKAQNRLHALQEISLQKNCDLHVLLAESQNNIHSYFPSEFEFSEQLGWIPKGWEPVAFESLITLIGGGTPKTSIDEYWNGDIPWFSVVDAPNDSDVLVINTEKHITQLGVDKSSTKILRVGTTIISARGTVGKCAFVGTQMAMNQSCYGINGKQEISDEFVYYLTRYQVSDLQKRGHGSVFNTITRETFKSIVLPFSGAKLTNEFSDIVSSLFDKILINNKQNIELTKLRDTLLPKLISGELQISNEVTTLEAES